jgi:hypothetical protein
MFLQVASNHKFTIIHRTVTEDRDSTTDEEKFDFLPQQETRQCSAVGKSPHECHRGATIRARKQARQA